jgi:hypothetical protein
MRVSVYNFAFGPAFCTEAWKKVGTGLGYEGQGVGVRNAAW